MDITYPFPKVYLTSFIFPSFYLSFYLIWPQTIVECLLGILHGGALNDLLYFFSFISFVSRPFHSLRVLKTWTQCLQLLNNPQCSKIYIKYIVWYSTSILGLIVIETSADGMIGLKRPCESFVRSAKKFVLNASRNLAISVKYK